MSEASTSEVLASASPTRAWASRVSKMSEASTSEVLASAREASFVEAVNASLNPNRSELSRPDVCTAAAVAWPIKPPAIASASVTTSREIIRSSPLTNSSTTAKARSPARSKFTKSPKSPVISVPLAPELSVKKVKVWPSVNAALSVKVSSSVAPPRSPSGATKVEFPSVGSIATSTVEVSARISVALRPLNSISPKPPPMVASSRSINPGVAEVNPVNTSISPSDRKTPFRSRIVSGSMVIWPDPLKVIFSPVSMSAFSVVPSLVKLTVGAPRSSLSSMISPFPSIT